MRSISLCLLLVLSVLSIQVTGFKFCCQATTVECRSCASEMTVEEFCMGCVEGSHDDVGCDDCFEKQLTTRCSIRAYLSTGLIGEYVPSCESDGSFSPMQCHGSTGHCWCVHEDGSEISGTRTQPGASLPQCAHEESVALTPCQKSALHSGNIGLLGGFVPQCEADGSYSSMQCHGSTGHCWCVDKNGGEIFGTRTQAGNPRPQCSREETVALTPCQKSALLSGNIGLLGAYVPQCEVDGSYSSIQCHGSAGMCWCVDKNGVEILGTRNQPGTPRPQCSEPTESFLRASSNRICCKALTAECMACSEGISVQNFCLTCLENSNRLGCNDCLSKGLTSRCLVLSRYPSALLGAFVPQCESDGSFSPRQCHGSTGMCWCVDDNGAEMPSTRNRPGEPLPQCLAKTPCQKAVHQATSSKKLLGAYVPQCEIDGSFSPRQCHGSTGHCWCVDESGVELLGTRVQPGSNLPQCSTPQISMLVTPATPCQREALEATSRRRIGAFVPKCEADGSYSAVQCHGSTGHCWCVDELGSEIDGTRLGPGQGQPQCSRSFSVSSLTVQSSCHSAALESSSRHSFGAFIPRCEPDGTYSPMQCHGSTGHCWCVAQDGTELDGTRRGPGQGQPECSRQRTRICCMAMTASCLACKAGVTVEEYCSNPSNFGCSNVFVSTPSFIQSSTMNSPCLSAALEGRSRRLIGAYIPQCEADGSYSSRQCHGSTGHCWCVDHVGVEIDGTRGRGSSVPDCDVARMSPCQKLTRGELFARSFVGRFTPKCEEDGSFSPMQCHGSTGYCWCVDFSGNEIDGTRVQPGGVLPDCITARLSPCQQSAKLSSSRRMIGAFIPSCEADGSYSSMQCHGSTGHCWCVNKLGEELLGTRHGPGSRPDCSSAQFTPCQLQSRQQSGLLGVFIPKCEQDGSYSKVQCHSSTGYCWCVDNSGNEVQGTRQGPGNRPDCSSVSSQSAYNCYTREVWSAEKRAWCCENVGLGC